MVKGSTIGIKYCPHCGKDTEFRIYGNKAYIICEDHNCWAEMSCEWGTNDKPYELIEKMKSDWNKRVLDDSYMKVIEEYYWIINTLKSNIQTIELIVNETIKRENGEPSSIQKYETVESFARLMEGFTSISINYLKDKGFIDK